MTEGSVPIYVVLDYKRIDFISILIRYWPLEWLLRLRKERDRH